MNDEHIIPVSERKVSDKTTEYIIIKVYVLIYPGTEESQKIFRNTVL